LQENDDNGSDEDEELRDVLDIENDNDDDDFNDAMNQNILRPQRDQNEEDAMDVDIHVALDELLGLRGPISALLRNMLWLLLFNTAYLGLFAFIPHGIGGSVFTRVIKCLICITYFRDKWLPGVITNFSQSNEKFEPFIGVLNSMITESKKSPNILQLSDIGTIIFGYVCIATTVFFIQIIVKYMEHDEDESSSPNFVEPNQVLGARNIDGHRQDLGRFDGIGLLENDQDRRQLHGRRENWNDGDQEENAAVNMRKFLMGKLLSMLDGAAAVVKVGILLFIKMFFLPLFVGIVLDLSTLDLFEKSLNDRALYFGNDIFSATLLHWVVGITFMLVVTVSVLQLREVVHPDLLANVIKPQEPQPDLLGNLLKETGFTHMKRMTVSVAIYAFLLYLYIWIPSKVLIFAHINKYIPIFHTQVWHILPSQLQTPLELLLFHLSMLALLEKYKNYIGKMQHKWLLIMCDWMGISDHILPKSIERFELVGIRSLYVSDSNDLKVNNSFDENEIDYSLPCNAFRNRFNSQHESVSPTNALSKTHTYDSFWLDLLKHDHGGREVDLFIEKNVQVVKERLMLKGSTDRTGRRVLNSTQSHISLSKHHFSLSEEAFSGIDSLLQLNDDRILIPTTIGSYRIQKQISENEDDLIQFWRESALKPILRPPEGWDDLGVGGAEVQGRWAWKKEKKSSIEEGICQRKPFFENKYQYEGIFGKWLLTQLSWSASYLLFKAIFLIVSSWLTALLFICTTLSFPLYAGRSLHHLLRIPNKYVHDPIAFSIGLVLIVLLLLQVISCFNIESSKARCNQFFRRTLRQRLNTSRSKIGVLLRACTVWFLVTPLLLGVEYDLFFFEDLQNNLNLKIFTDGRFLLLWKNGLTLLHVWAISCYLGVFHDKFWIDLGFFNRRDGNIRQNENGRRQEENNQISRWHGEDGVMKRFVNVLLSVIIDADWEKVESSAILDECTSPILNNTLISLIVPLCISNTFILLMEFTSGVSGFGSPISPSMKSVIYRLCFIIIISIQLGKVFKSPLQQWYDVAHKAARDDKYLVGKILVNYTQREKKND